MSYTVINFKTKKQLKEAVANYKNAEYEAILDNNGKPVYKYSPVRCFQPGLGPDLSNFTGVVYLEGPHYPKAHTWYAQAELKDGIVVKVS